MSTVGGCVSHKMCWWAKEKGFTAFLQDENVRACECVHVRACIMAWVCLSECKWAYLSVSVTLNGCEWEWGGGKIAADRILTRLNKPRVLGMPQCLIWSHPWPFGLKYGAKCTGTKCYESELLGGRLGLGLDRRDGVGENWKMKLSDVTFRRWCRNICPTGIVCRKTKSTVCHALGLVNECRNLHWKWSFELTYWCPLF